jgi:selenocysteine lyase/cysteine desulfurase
MKIENATISSPDIYNSKEMGSLTSKDNNAEEAFAVLTRCVHKALETYSNVHRGSGHNSIVSTHLFEQARDMVLEHLGVSKSKYIVVFCTPRGADVLKAKLEGKYYQCMSSQDIGLPLGLRALVVNRKTLPGGIPCQTGGGTASLVSPNKVTWAQAPDKFEAGTPAIINVIAFAKALQLIRHFGHNIFLNATTEGLIATEILNHDELETYSGRELLDKLRQTLIGSSVRVPTVDGPKPYINLDNGASTPTFNPIWDVVCKAWRQPRQVQQAIIQEVKSICTSILGAPQTDFDIIFTSNTTEAINLTAETLSAKSNNGNDSVILNTLLEHNSNELPWRMIPGFTLIQLSVNTKGFIDLEELEMLLCAYNQKSQYGKKRIKLVAVSGASNVLGTFNNLPEISRIVHLYGARLLVDAAQLVAHRRIEMDKNGIDYLAFSAHKVYAPFGTGVLIIRKGLFTSSLSELEKIQSSGEENIGGIAALGKALLLLQRIGFDLIQEEECALTERVIRGLAEIPGVKTYGITSLNSPEFAQRGGVIAFSLKSVMANVVAEELAIRGGIGVRFGCHCAHMLVKRLLKVPPLLAKLQHLILFLFPQIKLPGIARVSLGIGNCENDVDTLIKVLSTIAGQSRKKVDRKFASKTKILLTASIKKQIDEYVKATGQEVYTKL